jgi:hypothetical protein
MTIWNPNGDGDSPWANGVDDRVAERFFSKLDIGDCWEWTASRTPRGYGRFGYGGRRIWFAHRFAWSLLVGPIDDGLVIDHLCRNHACCNPDHLEPVPQKVNLHRGVGKRGVVECPRGHAYTETNSYINKKGVKICRTCRRDGMRKLHAAKRAAA